MKTPAEVKIKFDNRSLKALEKTTQSLEDVNSLLKLNLEVSRITLERPSINKVINTMTCCLEYVTF